MQWWGQGVGKDTIPSGGLGALTSSLPDRPTGPTQPASLPASGWEQEGVSGLAEDGKFTGGSA